MHELGCAKEIIYDDLDVFLVDLHFVPLSNHIFHVNSEMVLDEKDLVEEQGVRAVLTFRDFAARRDYYITEFDRVDIGFCL